MKLFRRLSRHAAATNLREVRKQNRIGYVTLCVICVEQAQSEWLAKPQTQQYLSSAGPNSIEMAYSQITDEAISYADYIWSVRNTSVPTLSNHSIVVKRKYRYPRYRRARLVIASGCGGYSVMFDDVYPQAQWLVEDTEDEEAIAAAISKAKSFARSHNLHPTL